MVFRLGRLSKLDSRSCAEFGNVMTVLKVFPLFEEGLSNNSPEWKAITLPRCPAVGISSRRRWFWAFWRMRSRGAFCRHSSPVKLGGRRRGSASEACLSYRSWSVRCAACLWSFCCRLVAFEGNLVILLHIFFVSKIHIVLTQLLLLKLRHWQLNFSVCQPAFSLEWIRCVCLIRFMLQFLVRTDVSTEHFFCSAANLLSATNAMTVAAWKVTGFLKCLIIICIAVQ